MNKHLAMQRLHMMGDWLKLKSFDQHRLMTELESFSDQWKPYNPRKKNNRFGLSVTSLDGGLSGSPDLDSLYEYNLEKSTNYTNQSFNVLTDVYQKSSILTAILKPYLPWLGRCHFIRLDSGGFFPEHYDIEKTNFDVDEVRLIGFIHKNQESCFKFCYDGRLLNFIQDGQLYYFNANKRHSVFSTENNSIQLVITLRFDQELFERILEQYAYR